MSANGNNPKVRSVTRDLQQMRTIGQSAARVLAAAGFLMGLAACPGPETTTPTEEEYNDIAQSIAPIIKNTYSSNGMVATAYRVTSGPQQNAARDNEARPQQGEPLAIGFATSTERVDETCSHFSGQLGGLSWEIDATCYALDGNEVLCISGLADRGSVSIQLDGEVTTSHYEGRLDYDANWSFEGYKTDVAHVTGETHIDAASRVTSIFDGTVRKIDLTLHNTVGIEFPVGRPHQAVGTVTASIDALWNDGTQEKDKHFEVDCKVELGGQGIASIVLDHKMEYALDLETGVLNPNAHPGAPQSPTAP